MANSTTHLDTIVQGQGSQDVKANSLFDAASPATLFGHRSATSSGLTWGFYGGNFTSTTGVMTQIGNGTLTLTASATNYIVADLETGSLSVSTSTTNWNDTAKYARCFSVVTNTSGPTSWTDYREIGKLTSPAFLPVAPVTKTAAFSVGPGENEIICNGSASITATLPTASAWVGRKVRIKTVAAYTVVSASSNVVPLAGGAAGTAILAATAGKYAELVSDGSNWIVMAAN